MTTYLLLTSDVFHDGSLCNFSHFLSAAIFATESVPNCNDATSEILDLQRDPPANDLALCEEYTIEVRTQLFAFSVFVKEVALRSMPGSPNVFVDTETFSVGALADNIRTGVTHGMAGSTKISGFFLAF